MNFFWLLNSLHKILGRSPFAVRLAISLRNQCNCIIRYCLNEGIEPKKNGELWLAQIVAKKSSVFIDVGANVGEWADIFITSMPKNSRGILFEPSDYAIKKIKHRFAKVEDIEIVQAGVSDKVGKMSFYEEPNAGESSSLVKGFSNFAAIEKVVDITTLDVEVERLQLDYIDFLKIDAEGYDLHVLRGASKLLAQQKIGVIQFEYNLPWKTVNSTLKEAFELLKSFGYQVFLLKNAGLFDTKFNGENEYFDYSNYVAISPKKIDCLQHLIKILKIF